VGIFAYPSLYTGGATRFGVHPRPYKFLITSNHILYFKASLLEVVGS
jgi:hypothetical protein